MNFKVKSDEYWKKYWPVYKGESFYLWQPDTGKYYAGAEPEKAINWLQKKRINASKGRASIHREFSEDHLNDRSTLPCYKARIAYRAITSRTNQRTVIVCLVPPKVFLAHTVNYFLWPKGNEKDEAFLLGVMSSMPFDWYARCFVESNVTNYIVNSLPVPRLNCSDSRWKRVVQVAGRLACPDKRFAEWAKKVGVGVGPLKDDEKNDMLQELDALVAALYELDEAQLVHIFETFHKKSDYREHLQGVLEYFHKWNISTCGC